METVLPGIHLNPIFLLQTGEFMACEIHKDFHGALSTGFQYLAEKYGRGDLEEYLKICGENMYGELAESVRKEGLSALEEYWKRIFSLEEAEFEIQKNGNKEIKLVVKRCPALNHMKKAGYPVYEDFCLQCRVINKVLAEKTGLKSKVKSEQDKERCMQIFKR